MRKGTQGKLFALAGMLLLGAGFFVFAVFSKTDAFYNSNGVQDPWGSGQDYSADCRFYEYNGSECGTNKFTGGIWGWSNYENHKAEYYKHVSKKVFYLGSSSDPAVGNYYYNSSSAVVHCPSGATVSGPHSPHIFASPGIDSIYDGRSHYWCSQNGAGVDPLPGPEVGKKFPDFHRTSTLTKVPNATDVYTFSSNNWTTRTQALAANGGYVKCKYTMSGPFGSENHYHCLSPDGSYEADGIYDESEQIMIATTPPDTTPPSMNNITPTFSSGNLVITWTTDEASNSIVDYGTSTSYGQTKSDPAMVMSHTITLTGLTAGTTYNFLVKSSDAANNTATNGPWTMTAPTTAATCTLTLSNNKTSYTGSENVNYTYTCSRASTVMVQVVKPDGVATTYNTGTNVTTNSMGFSVSNLSAGSYTLRICINDSTCAAGSTVSVPFSVTSSTTSGGTGPIVTPMPLTQYGTNKYSIKVEDNDGIKEFSVKKSNGSSLYGGSPGATGNVGSCTGTAPMKSVESGTVTVESSEFPLQAWVLDCSGNGGSSGAFTVPAPGGVTTTTPAGMTLSGTIFKDGQYIDPATGSQRSCVSPNGWMKEGALASGARGFHCMLNYTPVATDNPPASCVGTVYTTSTSGSMTTDYCSTTASTNSNWVQQTWTFSDGTSTSMVLTRTDKEYTDYIASVNASCRTKPKSTPWKSGAGDDTATNWQNFGIPDCGTSGTVTPPVVIPPGDTGTARACKANEKCPKGSWCESGGQQCYFPTAELTCVPWSTTDTMAAPVPIMGGSMPKCPSGTSPCQPPDPNNSWTSKCVAPGDTVKYNPSGSSSGGDFWCGGGTQGYYSKTKNSDGTYNMTCEYSDGTPPSGYSSCRPGDKYCKQKGDSWTAAEEKSLTDGGGYYCMSSQECSSSSGGSCVGWNETCPSGTLYCPTNAPSMSGSTPMYTSKCGEPDTTTDIDASSGSGFWCGGGASTTFYNKGQGKAYCPPKKPMGPPDYGMLSAPEVKATLEKLGSGWKLCNPFQNTGGSGTTGYIATKCLEPGQTGTSSDWCAWNPPGSGGYSGMNGGPRTCPSLDGAVVTPPPDDRMCLQVITRAENPKTGECQDFPNSCTPDGWVKKQCEIKRPSPDEMRECRPGEFPNSVNMCRVPMYQWVYADKKWEKCPAGMQTALTLPSDKHTDCQSMHFEIEEPWRTLRYTVRPPEKFGQWYMPPWDASVDIKQYNPQSDRFEECKKNGIAVMPRPGDWFAPCTSVPETDKEWLLAMYRAQYKMHQLYSQVNPPDRPAPPDMPPVPEPPKPITPPEVPIGQCKPYLLGVRTGLNGDKQFWKDVKRQVKALPADHPDAVKINELLKSSKQLIVDVEKLSRATKCDKYALAKIQEKLRILHEENFAELSAYLASIRDYAEIGFCTSSLSERARRLRELVKGASDDEAKAELEEFASEIEAKAAEVRAKIGDFEFDAVFECREYLNEVEVRFAPLVRLNDRDVRRVVEQVLEKELAPVLAQLSQQSEERKQKIDQLLVQVASLQKALEEVTKEAQSISQKIAVSYKAVAAIEDKFAAEKAQIEAAKSRLIPLVEEATRVMKKTRCVTRRYEPQIIGEFGMIGALNLIGDQQDVLERRLNAFISACNAREVDPSDITAFARAVDDVEAGNLRASYEKGITPFPDVPTHEWYYGGMVAGARSGFMTQGRPNETVLRQDALLMLLRVKGLTDNELKGDCELPSGSAAMNASPYARCAVAQAIKGKLTLNGSMTAPVQRGDIALWISQLHLVPEISAERAAELSAGYIDLKPSVPMDWRSAIARAVQAKIMVGQVGEKESTWQPFDNLTRASLAVVLDQLGQLTQPR